MKHWYVLVSCTKAGHDRRDEWRRLDKCPSETWQWRGWTMTVTDTAPIFK